MFMHADDEEEAEVDSPKVAPAAPQAEHTSRWQSSAADTDPVPATTEQHQQQSSSKRTTADSVLECMLQDVSSSAMPRPHSGAAAEAGPSDVSNTDSSVLNAWLHDSSHANVAAEQPSTSKPVHDCTSRRSSASEAAAEQASESSHADQTLIGHRSTADSVLESMLIAVEDEAAQAIGDSLLDTVLAEVAGAASRQRTTADSILDTMVDDLASSKADADVGPDSLLSARHQDGHMQRQLQAVSFLVVLC